MLLILSGLPATGKTTIAREVARQTGAVHVRIDSIEQALRNAGMRVEAEGYRVGYAIAEDNLRLGRVVIADSVNPWPLTREAWRSAAGRAAAPYLDVEIVCSDPAVHRARAESRAADIPGHVLPAWEDIVRRDYRGWEGERVQIDTAYVTLDEAVRRIRATMRL